MHRFLSRSDESDDLTRRVTRKRVPQVPANVLYGTLRRPTECNAVGAQRTPYDCVDAVESLCIMRAKPRSHYSTRMWVSSKSETRPMSSPKNPAASSSAANSPASSSGRLMSNPPEV